MMKKTCFLFLLLFCGLALIAQDFEIVSVESLPLDMSAREEIYKDHKDNQCALLRIATQNIAPNQRELFNFIPDYGSELVQRATRDGEIWLWVSPGLKYLRVKHRNWGQYELRLIDHVARVESLHTYKIIIKGAMTLPLQEQESKVPTQQYLAFRISPTNATLFVNDELWEVGSDGSAVRFVNFGTYNYRVMAPNYLPETGTVTVNDPDNTQTVPVSLKPDFVEVTLKVDADAEIWVNNEKKGTRTWTGQLGKGTYKIACKKEGHETTMISKEITAEMNGQSITLPVPIPIYGSLNVESTPIGATIYIDGKEAGKTPKFIGEILIGQHDVRLAKDGYTDQKETVFVKKEENTKVQIPLQKQNVSIIPSTSAFNSSAYKGVLPGLFSVADDRQVRFSQGNLQYQVSTGKWRFAERQWDTIGNENSISNSLWIDLFGWGTSGYGGKQPGMTSTSNTDYCLGYKDISGTNYDWGVYNAISNGGNQTNIWRTLTSQEWVYIINKRNTSSGIRFAKAVLEGVNGLVLLPDDWSSDYYSLNETNQNTANYNSNSFTASQWSVLEQHGAVFLPAAGGRYGASTFSVGTYGIYWSTIGSDRDYARRLHFNNTLLNPNDYGGRYHGISVRLVQDN